MTAHGGTILLPLMLVGSIFLHAYLYKVATRTVEQLPESLGKLKNLKHFELRWSRVEDLPKSMGSLENLETISLIGNHRLGYLPKEMVTLPKLSKISLGLHNRNIYIPPALETKDGVEVRRCFNL